MNGRGTLVRVIEMPKKQFYNVATDPCAWNDYGNYPLRPWFDADNDGDCEFHPEANNFIGCGDCLHMGASVGFRNCSNAFLRPGQFTKPHTTYLGPLHPNIGDACYLFKPDVASGNVIQSLDGECKSLYGNPAIVCYDTTGAVVNCATPPQKYWRVSPTQWAERQVSNPTITGSHFGACLQLVEYFNTPASSGGKWWIWKGCPTGLVDEQLGTGFRGAFPTGSLQYLPVNMFADGLGSRFNGTTSLTSYNGVGYNPGTFISGISNYNPSNIDGSDGVLIVPILRYGCFEALRKGSCPEFMHDDPANNPGATPPQPHYCLPDEVAPDVPGGYVYYPVTEYPGPHNAVYDPPYYVREYEAYLPNPKRSYWVRGSGGQLFIVGDVDGTYVSFNRYTHVLPENSFLGYRIDGDTLPHPFNSPTIAVDTSNHLHVFYQRNGTVYHIRSEDSGYSFTPRVAGPIHLTDNVRIVGFTYAGSAETYFVTQEEVCTGGYDVMRVLYRKSGDILVFGYKTGKWWVRSVERNNDGTWEASDENEVTTTDDNTCDGAQELPDGKIVFLCYSTSGKLQRLLCESINKDGVGTWEPEDLLDALANEYFSFAVHLEPGGDTAVCLVWKPNTLGRVWDGPDFQGGWSPLGKMYTRMAERDPGTGLWTIQPEVLAWDTGGAGNPQYGRLIKRGDDKYEYRGGSGSKVTVNLKSDGTGTWNNA